ncbi:hypothetical protein LBMAG53_28980 [Planctomycetota bacterium]|nr:hypothetical protein LBMAG53_28980 [Planctomycetota bacterium]
MRLLSIIALVFAAKAVAAAQPGPITGPVGFAPLTPHYMATVIEFRDPNPDSTNWPAIFHGRTVEPTVMTFSETAIDLKSPLVLGAEAGSLMRSGNQRRLIGEILPRDGAKEGEDKPLPLPKVTINTITAGKGETLTFSGKVVMDGKTIPIEGTGKSGRSTNDGDPVITLTFVATFKGKALGLVKFADQDVQVVVHTAGKAGAEPSPAKAAAENAAEKTK